MQCIIECIIHFHYLVIILFVLFSLDLFLIFVSSVMKHGSMIYIKQEMIQKCKHHRYFLDARQDVFGQARTKRKLCQILMAEKNTFSGTQTGKSLHRTGNEIYFWAAGRERRLIFSFFAVHFGGWRRTIFFGLVVWYFQSKIDSKWLESIFLG